ncbi:MAG: uracil-DNA glycosylase [Salinivenus sp.]
MLSAVWSLFEDHLFSAPSTDEAFNPYRDCHPDLDIATAPARRRENLRAYLSCYDAPPPLFLLLEAPGPWGCRFTGVPITSEAQLVAPDFPITGQKTSRKDDPHTEYSASIFWRVLQPYFPHFFVWNSLPLHPHDPGEPLSIRTPRRTEVREWKPLLMELLDALAPDRIVGVGRKAERALNEAGAHPTYVRHPSQGGAKKFESGMNELMVHAGLSPES